MTPTLRTSHLILLAALVSLGCASTSTTSPAAAPAVPEPPTAAREAPGEVAIQPAGAAALDPVYFDTDRALLRADARAALKARAEAILAHPEWGAVTIEGHCDERGSDEYNLALGERRASAVERYLVDLGVPASRIRTVTFGESKPAVPGHDEASWRLNRRSELRSQALRSASR
jgi:peptidoglycan-associated lipoprotein